MKLRLLPLTLLLCSPVFAQQTLSDHAATPPSSATAIHGEPHLPPAQPSGMGLRVLVVESTSANPGHDQDGEWVLVAEAEGFRASIVPQSTLSSTDYYRTTDILVVSSGVIDLPEAAVRNLIGYLRQGGSIYLQGEYLPSYAANQAFQSLVRQDGGDFTVGETKGSNLAPTIVTGHLSDTPYVTGSLSYHWYGCDGGGASVTPFMHFNGDDLGWTYTMSNGARIVHNTDQDWIRTRTNTKLVANILHWLARKERFLVSTSELVAGAGARLEVQNATPNGAVYSAYSFAGVGPSYRSIGRIDLAHPIKRWPDLTADASGNASYLGRIPAGMAGASIWIQAYDVTSQTLSNIVWQTIR